MKHTTSPAGAGRGHLAPAIRPFVTGGTPVARTAETAVPRNNTARAWVVARDAFLVLFGSVLLAVSAHAYVWLPGSLVPVTGQTFVVLLLGALLGRRLGAAAVTAYLLEGAAGLPVFAGGGAGAAWLAGPTGGYLLGFVVAAGLTGTLAERGWDRTPARTAAALALGAAVILLLGAAWLAVFVGPTAALTAGVLPFLPGEAWKVAAATALLPAGRKLLHP